MHNGFQGSTEKWEQMEAPLLQLDDEVAKFASERNFEVRKNYHNWPERSVQWSSFGINRSIHIVPGDTKHVAFHAAIAASKDSQELRLMKHQKLLEKVPLDEIKKDFHNFLVQAAQTVESWTEADLDQRILLS